MEFIKADKVIRLSFVLVLYVFSIMSVEAQVTREQLLRLFYQASSSNRMGNSEKAINIYQKIATLAPQNPDAYLRMAEIHDSLNDFSAAADMYRKYLSLEKDDLKTEALRKRLVFIESQLASDCDEKKQNVKTEELKYKHGAAQMASSLGDGVEMYDSDLTLFASKDRKRKTEVPAKKKSSTQELTLFSLSVLEEKRNINVDEKTNQIVEPN